MTLPSHRLPQYHLPSLLNPPDVERSLHFSSFPAGLEPRFPYNTDKHFPSSSHSKYYTHPASYTPSTRLPFSPSTNNHRPSLERSHLSVLPAMACGHPALLSIPDQALRPTPFTAFLRVCWLFSPCLLTFTTTSVPFRIPFPCSRRAGPLTGQTFRMIHWVSCLVILWFWGWVSSCHWWWWHDFWCCFCEGIGDVDGKDDNEDFIDSDNGNQKMMVVILLLYLLSFEL